MEDILDEINIDRKQDLFSKLSFALSLITLGLFIYIFSFVPARINVSEEMPKPPEIILLATLLFCFIGIVLTILSFAKNEHSSWFKWVGGILNILLFLVIVGSTIFAMFF